MNRPAPTTRRTRAFKALSGSGFVTGWGRPSAVGRALARLVALTAWFAVALAIALLAGLSREPSPTAALIVATALIAAKLIVAVGLPVALVISIADRTRPSTPHGSHPSGAVVVGVVPRARQQP